MFISRILFFFIKNNIFVINNIIVKIRKIPTVYFFLFFFVLGIDKYKIRIKNIIIINRLFNIFIIIIIKKFYLGE
jgi:hypothetical protein